MRRTNLIYIAIFIAVIVAISTAITIEKNKKNNLLIRCTGDIITQRNIHEIGPGTLHAKIFLFLYKNGTGFYTLKGDLSINKNIYILNREVKFNYSDVDNDDTYTFEITKTTARTNDNLPIVNNYPILGNTPLSFYLNITTIDDLYVFNALSFPIFLCNRF